MRFVQSNQLECGESSKQEFVRKIFQSCITSSVSKSIKFETSYVT